MLITFPNQVRSRNRSHFWNLRTRLPLYRIFHGMLRALEAFHSTVRVDLEKSIQNRVAPQIGTAKAQWLCPVKIKTSDCAPNCIGSPARFQGAADFKLAHNIW